MPFLRKSNLFTVLLVIILLALGSFFWWKKNISPVVSIYGELPPAKTFIVKKGEGLPSIAQRLKKEKLIRSSLAFKILLLSKRLADKIQTGSFYLNPSLTSQQIAFMLTHGTADVWLTFPEGWRREEYARRLTANLQDFSYQEFLKETESFEGYLFPDTYLIPRQASISAVVKILLSNSEKKFSPEFEEVLNKKDLTKKQALILASIVERESKYEDDRPIVTGILIKRWQNNWPLQADATVQYAKANSRLQTPYSKLENWWEPITKADLKLDSLYNTYKYPGLPPTPICNPGIAAIKAAVYPQKTSYWYYLSDREGRMHYSVTLEEHNRNISKYLK